MWDKQSSGHRWEDLQARAATLQHTAGAPAPARPARCSTSLVLAVLLLHCCCKLQAQPCSSRSRAAAAACLPDTRACSCTFSFSSCSARACDAFNSSWLRASSCSAAPPSSPSAAPSAGRRPRDSWLSTCAAGRGIAECAGASLCRRWRDRAVAARGLEACRSRPG